MRGYGGFRVCGDTVSTDALGTSRAPLARSTSRRTNAGFWGQGLWLGVSGVHRVRLKVLSLVFLSSYLNKQGLTSLIISGLG